MPRAERDRRDRRRFTALPVFLVGALLATGLVSGCSGDPSPGASSPAPSMTPTRPAEPSTSPPSSSSTTPLPTAAAGSGLADRLLTAAELPAPGDWRDGHTGKAPDRPFGTCAQYGPLTIGALRAVQTRWSAPHARGAELLASFPDATNTGRAEQVLRTWHAKCGDRARVGDLADAPVPGGTAAYYTVRPKHGDASGIFGFVVAGKRIALLSFEASDEAGTQVPRPTVMAGILAAAASKLG